jgi:hypothetical protein
MSAPSIREMAIAAKATQSDISAVMSQSQLIFEQKRLVEMEKGEQIALFFTIEFLVEAVSAPDNFGQLNDRALALCNPYVSEALAGHPGSLKRTLFLSFELVVHQMYLRNLDQVGDRAVSGNEASVEVPVDGSDRISDADESGGEEGEEEEDGDEGASDSRIRSRLETIGTCLLAHHFTTRSHDLIFPIEMLV